MKQIPLYRCHYCYVDKAALLDEHCEWLFEMLASRHHLIHLVLHDAWELEQVKNLEAFGYLCEVLYGEDLVQRVALHRETHGYAEKETVLFLYQDAEAAANMLLIALGQDRAYATIDDFLAAYCHQERSMRRKVILVLVSCLVYFVLYFHNLDVMPLWMVEGPLAFLLFLLPAMLLLLTFLYGLYRSIYTAWDVLDWIG